MSQEKEFALVHIVNHMHFGGCQKIIYELISGLESNFNNIYLITRPGYYYNLLKNNSHINLVDRSNLSFFDVLKQLRALGKEHHRIILHTHNRKDILFKYFLGKYDHHIHTFHSAYLNKNVFYKFIRPQFSVSISKTVSEYLISNGICNLMIYNGIDVGGLKYNPRCSKHDPTPTLKMIYIGRITKDKGFNDLFNALLFYKNNTISKIKLEVVGDGENTAGFQNLLASNPNFEVNFRGFQSNPWESINEQDVLVIPSHFEGFCLVAAEGAAIGIPIIGNDILALREVLDFSDDSNFFNTQDSESIMTTITKFVNNLSFNRAVALKNSQRVKDKFTKREMLKRYIDVYNSFVK